MRQTIPMRWIEQAEANEVLAAAQFERAPEPTRRGAARRALMDRLDEARAWITPADAVGWLLLQAQPAPVRRPVHQQPASRDGKDYPSRW